MANLIPRTWQRCTDETILDCYDEICDRAKELGYLQNAPQLYLFRSYKRWGECRVGQLTTVIGVNEVYLKEPKASKNTLIHELAHAITRNEGHTTNWKTIGNEIGALYGEKMKRQMSEAEKGVTLPKPEMKYTLECPCCHYQWEYARMQNCVKHPDEYVCKTCKQTLIRIR